MNEEEFPEDSDSSDEDYVPSNKPEDVPSEVDSDCEEEPYSDEEGNRGGNVKNKKRKLTSAKKNKKFKQDSEATVIDGSKEPSKEKEQNIDDIWADFMKDTGFKSKSSSTPDKSKDSVQKTRSTSTTSDKISNATKKRDDRVNIKQVFNFAGEEIEVEKQVPIGSAEARLFFSETGMQKSEAKPKLTGLSGMSSVLSSLSKKPKISTLEKTKLDWDRFKKDENIEEELQTYKKGKDGYLERQDFLERADLRRFEIEKEARSVERSKRMNNL